MNNYSRKTRIESILKTNFTPKLLIVRDDSKQHQGHVQVDEGSLETHYYIKMVIDFPEGLTRVALHRKVYKLLEKEFSKGLHALELNLRSS